MGMRVRRARARGWRSLLWAALLFLAVQVGAALWLEAHGTRVRFPELVRVLRAAEAAPRPDVIFFGSSRTESAVNGPRVTAVVRHETGDADFVAFRAALPVGDTVAQNRVMAELLARGRRPALAILEISPEFLARSNPRMSEHLRRQTRWRDVATDVPEAVRANLLSRLLTAYLMPLHVHRFHLCREAGRVWEEGWDRGGAWGPVGEHQEPTPPAVVPTPDDNARLLAAALSVTGPVAEEAEERQPNESFREGAHWVGGWLRRYQIGGKSAACLEEMLERCRRQGVVPLLLSTPVSAAHRELYTTPIEMAYREYVNRLCDRYGCVYVDARGWCGDAYFRDTHHMTVAGESLFSERFAREVLAPVWREYRRGDGQP